MSAEADELRPEELAEIERRKAESAGGEIGVVLDPEDEEAHFAACAEIDELRALGELVPMEEYIAKSRAQRALRQRRTG